MSKMTIVEGNSNDKDNVRAIMVKGEKGEKGETGDPTKLSQLVNDVGYITPDAINLSNYYDKDETDSLLDEKINIDDIVDDLTSTDTEKPLSAKKGKDLKDLIQQNTELINQKQLELGAVPSDIVPYKSSTNWVTSGGVYNSLEPLRGDTYIKNANSFLEQNRYDRWIDGRAFSSSTTGKHVAYAVTNETYMYIKGHDTRGSYYALAKSYAIPTGADDIDFCVGTDPRKQVNAGVTEKILIPDDCRYIIIGITNDSGSSYKPSLLSFEYISNHDFTYVEAVDTGDYKVNIYEKGANHKGWTGGNSWEANGSHYVIPVNNEQQLHLKAMTDKNAFYLFLKSYIPPASAGETWDYCDGYNLRQAVTNGTEEYIDIPDDCNYIVIGSHNSSNTSYEPIIAELIYETTLKKKVNELESGISTGTYSKETSINTLRSFIPDETTTNETYIGERINVSNDIVKTHYFTHYGLGVGKGLHTYNGLSQQGLAIYGDYAFFTYDTGYIRIYNLENETIVAEYPMPEGVQQSNNHAGNANFGSLFYDNEDTFPLLYISSYLEKKCYVLRVTLTGCTLVQTIYTTDGTTDGENNPVISTTWHYYVDNDGRIITHGNYGLMVFNCPDLSQETVYLDLRYPIINIGRPIPSPYVFAGVAARNGNLYILAYTSGSYSHLFVYNYEQCRIVSKLVFPSNIHGYEFEGIGFWNKDIIVGYAGWNQLMGYKFV